MNNSIKTSVSLASGECARLNDVVFFNHKIVYDLEKKWKIDDFVSQSILNVFHDLDGAEDYEEYRKALAKCVHDDWNMKMDIDEFLDWRSPYEFIDDCLLIIETIKYTVNNSRKVQEAIAKYDDFNFMSEEEIEEKFDRGADTVYYEHREDIWMAMEEFYNQLPTR
jgi:hypothetical protein|tara:strand:- start:752 stop:1249 length:498 start_codon:yes stop_codon:yes gene_type:complete